MQLSPFPEYAAGTFKSESLARPARDGEIWLSRFVGEFPRHPRARHRIVVMELVERVSASPEDLARLAGHCERRGNGHASKHRVKKAPPRNHYLEPKPRAETVAAS